jgi:hypothetical protein
LRVSKRRQDLVRVEDSVRVKRLLDLAHHADRRRRFGKVEKVRLAEADSVLGRDGAAVRRCSVIKGK